MVQPPKYSVSARSKPLSSTMHEWFNKYAHSGVCNYNEITGVFGFTQERSPLYGGRLWGLPPDITEEDYAWIKEKGLEYKILLSGDKVSQKHYEESFKLLDKYNIKGNTVVVTNDTLAKWIRRDYPNYSLEASVIKHAAPSNFSFSDIDQILELYDTMVLPQRHHQDEENLKKIKQKDRIVLFTSGSCGIYCENQICYPSVAIVNRDMGAGQERAKCIMDEKPILHNLGIDKITRYDIDQFRKWGFSNFKVLPNFTEQYGLK